MRTTEPVSLETEIATALDALSAKSSLHAKHLPTGREIAIRADEPMNSLSVIKLPIMVLAYRDAENGNARPWTAIYHPARKTEGAGSGLLQTFAPGLSPTYRDLVTQMIVTSDNTATDLLIAKPRSRPGERASRRSRIPQHAASAHHGRSLPARVGARGPVERLSFPGRGLRQRLPDRRWRVRPELHLRGRLEGVARKRMTAQRDVAAAGADSHGRDRKPRVVRRNDRHSQTASSTRRGLPRFLPDGVDAAHKTGDWPPIAGKRRRDSVSPRGSDDRLDLREPEPRRISTRWRRPRRDCAEARRASDGELILHRDRAEQEGVVAVVPVEVPDQLETRELHFRDEQVACRCRVPAGTTARLPGGPSSGGSRSR